MLRNLSNGSRRNILKVVSQKNYGIECFMKNQVIRKDVRRCNLLETSDEKKKSKSCYKKRLNEQKQNTKRKEKRNMIRAINDKVVGVMLKRTQTSGGIIIPEAVNEPHAYCKVISVGEEVTKVEVGDIIVSHIRGGMDTVINYQIMKVLKEDEVYGILTDEDTLKALEAIKLEEPKEASKIVSLT